MYQNSSNSLLQCGYYRIQYATYETASLRLTSLTGPASRSLCTSFASYGNSGSSFRAYIVGRKPADRQRAIDECLKTCTKAGISYVTVGDLSLLGDVDKVCTELVWRIKAAEQAGDLAGQ